MIDGEANLSALGHRAATFGCHPGIAKALIMALMFRQFRLTLFNGSRPCIFGSRNEGQMGQAYLTQTRNTSKAGFALPGQLELFVEICTKPSVERTS